MAKQKGGFRPGAGRKPGGKNRATIEREEREAELRRAWEAEAEMKRRTAQKLGPDVLEDFMKLFMGLAALYQPAPPGAPPNPHEQEKKFDKYSRLAMIAAEAVAPYHKPKLRAIVVSATPGMPTDAPMLPAPTSERIVTLDDPAALTRLYQSRIRAAR